MSALRRVALALLLTGTWPASRAAHAQEVTAVAPAAPAAPVVPAAKAAPAAAPAAAEHAAAPMFRPKARVMTGFELEREQPSSDQGGSDSTDYGFFLRQARVGVEAEWGRVSLDVSAELSDALRPATGSAIDRPPYLRNAFLDVELHKAFRIRAGRYKRPFSRIELESNGVLPFRGRGLNNRYLVRDGQWGKRAIGVMLWGKAPGKLRWYASLTQPSWAPDGDLEANGVDALARVEWKPVRGLSLGLAGGHKVEARTGTQQRNANAVNADLRVQAGALTFVLDAMLAQLTTAASAGGASSALPVAYGVTSYATYDIPLGGELRLQPIVFAEYAEAEAEYARTEAVRLIGGLNLHVGTYFRVMPQVELVRPTDTASASSPWTSSESYYVMLVARM